MNMRINQSSINQMPENQPDRKASTGGGKSAPFASNPEGGVKVTHELMAGAQKIAKSPGNHIQGDSLKPVSKEANASDAKTQEFAAKTPGTVKQATTFMRRLSQHLGLVAGPGGKEFENQSNGIANAPRAGNVQSEFEARKAKFEPGSKESQGSQVGQPRQEVGHLSEKSLSNHTIAVVRLTDDQETATRVGDSEIPYVREQDTGGQPRKVPNLSEGRIQEHDTGGQPRKVPNLSEGRIQEQETPNETPTKLTPMRDLPTPAYQLKVKTPLPAEPHPSPISDLPKNESGKTLLPLRRFIDRAQVRMKVEKKLQGDYQNHIDGKIGKLISSNPLKRLRSSVQKNPIFRTQMMYGVTGGAAAQLYNGINKSVTTGVSESKLKAEHEAIEHLLLPAERMADAFENAVNTAFNTPPSGDLAGADARLRNEGLQLKGEYDKKFSRPKKPDIPDAFDAPGVVKATTGSKKDKISQQKGYKLLLKKKTREPIIKGMNAMADAYVGARALRHEIESSDYGKTDEGKQMLAELDKASEQIRNSYLGHPIFIGAGEIKAEDFKSEKWQGIGKALNQAKVGLGKHLATHGDKAMTEEAFKAMTPDQRSIMVNVELDAFRKDQPKVAREDINIDTTKWTEAQVLPESRPKRMINP